MEEGRKFFRFSLGSANHGKWLRIGCKTMQDTRNHPIFDLMISVGYDSLANPAFGTTNKKKAFTGWDHP